MKYLAWIRDTETQTETPKRIILESGANFGPKSPFLYRRALFEIERPQAKLLGNKTKWST